MVVSANRRHRRGRVFIGERWRLRRAREAGWFTGRLFIARDPGGEVTYSGPVDPRAVYAWKAVLYPTTLGPGVDGDLPAFDEDF